MNNENLFLKKWLTIEIHGWIFFKFHFIQEQFKQTKIKTHDSRFKMNMVSSSNVSMWRFEMIAFRILKIEPFRNEGTSNCNWIK